MAIRHLGVVMTGGTIGSTVNGHETEVQLIGHNLRLPGWLDICIRAAQIAETTVESPINIHSEQARTSDWVAVGDCIKGLAVQGVDAVLVLHGTDTMAYSAAALSYSLLDTHLPVVLTGSNLPADHPDSDAATNVEAALAVLSHLDDGTYLVFAGAQGLDAEIHAGTRVIKRRVAGQAFGSPIGGPIAKFGLKGMTQLQEHPKLYGQSDLVTNITGKKVENGFEPAVLQLQMYPGLPLAALRDVVTNGSIKGVVCELYPCATAPTGSDIFAIDAFADFADQHGVVVAATAPVTPDLSESYYPSLDQIRESKIEFLQGVLTTTATVKMMWALASCGDDSSKLRQLLRLPVAGDTVDPLTSKSIV